MDPAGTPGGGGKQGDAATPSYVPLAREGWLEMPAHRSAHVRTKVVNLGLNQFGPRSRLIDGPSTARELPGTRESRLSTPRIPVSFTYSGVGRPRETATPMDLTPLITYFGAKISGRLFLLARVEKKGIMIYRSDGIK